MKQFVILLLILACEKSFCQSISKDTLKALIQYDALRQLKEKKKKENFKSFIVDVDLREKVIHYDLGVAPSINQDTSFYLDSTSFQILRRKIDSTFQFVDSKNYGTVSRKNLLNYYNLKGKTCFITVKEPLDGWDILQFLQIKTLGNLSGNPYSVSSGFIYLPITLSYFQNKGMITEIYLFIYKAFYSGGKMYFTLNGLSTLNRQK